MDRSLLSQQEVIAASRDFVCIRLATYENQTEADFCAKLFTRNGALENTTYAVLTPDGKTPLVRPGRGPHYRSPAAMASVLKQISARFQSKGDSKTLAVPYMDKFDVALNVASCDLLPLVVVSGRNQAEIDAMSRSLQKPAWKSELGGQFVFAAVKETQPLKAITGLKNKQGFLIVQPGTFGLTAHLLQRLPATATEAEITSAMMSVAQANRHKRKNHGSHISLGINLGIDWKTKIPVTDQQSLRAKERHRQGR